MRFNTDSLMCEKYGIVVEDAPFCRSRFDMLLFFTEYARYIEDSMGLICKAAISTVSVSVGVNEHSTQSSKEQLLQWYNGMKKCQHEVVLICVCVCVCDVSVNLLLV